MVSHLRSRPRARFLPLFVVAAGFVLTGVAPAAGAASPSVPLTVRATVGSGSETRRLVVITAGKPPTRAARLVDATGKHKASVKVLTAKGACHGAPVHYTSIGRRRWCLQLTGLRAGVTFQGELVGPSATLALTVTARNGLAGPIVTCVIALLLAMLLVWLGTHTLSSAITTLLLQQAIRNDDGVEGLAAWARTAVNDGRLSSADVLARVRWAKGPGKRQLIGTRKALQTLLAAADIPQCPLRMEAEAEAERQNVTRQDLLTEAGTRAQSTAEHLAAVVADANQAILGFDQGAAGLLAHIPANDPSHGAAETLMHNTQAYPAGYLSELTLNQVKGEFQDTLTQLHTYVPQAQAAPQLAMLAIAGPGLAQHMLGSYLGTPSGTTIAARAVTTAAALLITAGLTMLAAVITVIATQYLPNQTFGTLADYLTLAATSLGSSTAAGIVTVLALWRGPNAWYG